MPIKMSNSFDEVSDGKITKKLKLKATEFKVPNEIMQGKFIIRLIRNSMIE